MDEFKDLPIFPQNVVMFPHAKIALRIFEERYKIMIGKCIKSKEDFGINFFHKEKLFLTGCTVEIINVEGMNESGEFEIIVKGLRRFKIMNYELCQNGFFIGEVIFSKNSNFITDNIKFLEAVNNYNELVEIVYKGSIKPIDADDEKWVRGDFSVSFFIAEKCGLHLTERQNLLEINNEDDRIFFILKYFKEVMPKLKDDDRIAKIIMSNGYLTQ